MFPNFSPSTISCAKQLYFWPDETLGDSFQEEQEFGLLKALLRIWGPSAEMSSCKATKCTPRNRQSLPVTVKQFIRNVRAAKTIADERAVIQKESAAIRASFREESADSNVRLVNMDTNPKHKLILDGDLGATM